MEDGLGHYRVAECLRRMGAVKGLRLARDEIRDLPEHPSETRKRPPNRFALRVGSADVGGNHHQELGVECRGDGPALRRRALLGTEHVFFVSQPGEKAWLVC